MKRIVGPNPRSRFCHHGGAGVERLGVDDDAVLLEQLRRAASVSANDGISVWKFVVGLRLLRSAAASVNVPWTSVPFDVIDLTLPAFTCCRKNGLYGTRTRGCACVARDARSS